ncbi:S-layer homology domain-containing protein [Paenibacillus sp. 1_12]|uniref:S-layer homology domain-containing protein n=1 Tax=Paenibacillus sp. 1_12 TaxID=1566278 RepID=UPI0008E4E758|nr:S-layer homology domain-containing protein [Paenibacillus sp. 1_12]SFK99759.1 S-layer homology domain-containing protein [Paenibacillus sp. 1_12]
MSGFINKNKRWYSLTLIVMMLVTIIFPNTLVQKTYAAPETVAGWTFSANAADPVSIPATSGTNANRTNGKLTVSGARAVTYSSPSIYTANWQVAGGYWQAQISTKDYSQLTLSSKHMGAPTGPKEFKIQYSTDGITFTDVPNGSYAVTGTLALGPNNLVLPSAVDDKTDVYIRWFNYSTVPISSGTATGSSGTSRIADIVINGVKIGQSQSTAPDANKIAFDTLTHVSSVSGAVYGGADVKVYLADNSVAGMGTADTNGAFNLTINNPNSERKVYITSLESGKTESSKVSVDFGAIPKTSNPDASKITFIDDFTTIKGVAGAVYGLAAVKVYLPDNTPAGTTTAQNDGSFNLTISNAAHQTSAFVSATASGRDESDKVSVSIPKTLKPDANKIAFTNSTSVIGSAGAAANNAQITVYFDDNSVAGTATATANGSFNLTVSNPGGKTSVYVTAKETGKIESDKTTVNSSVPGATYSPGDVVLSQLYVNGGNSGAFYKTKFFELYNTTNQDINFNNEWALIYTSATGTSFGAGNKLSGVIKAHGYYLVTGANGSSCKDDAGKSIACGLDLPVTADLTTTLNPSGSAGGILTLANSVTGLSSQDDTKAMDIVTFGNGTTASFATKTDHWGSPFFNSGVGGGVLLRKTNAGSDPRIAFGLGNGWFTKDPSKDFVMNAPSSPAKPDEVIIHNSKFMLTPDSTKITFSQAGGTASVLGEANAVPGSSTVKAYLYTGGTVTNVQQATAAANGSFTLSFSNPGNNQSIYLTHTDSSEPTPMESNYSRVDVTGYPVGITPIDQLRTNDVKGFPLNLGYTATIEGVATSNNNALGSEKTHFYLQDATGGINIIDGKAPTVAIQAGNKFRIEGRVVFTAGMTRFVPTTITYVGPDQMPEPLAIGLNSLNSYATAEPLEGKLVSISGTVTNIPASGPDYDVSISDDTGNLSIIRILGTSGIDVSKGVIEQGDSYTFKGIVGQSKSVSPFTTGYYVLPRSLSDIKGELQFTHTPLTKAYTGIDVSFTAKAKNADSITLYYKGTADLTFSPIIMSSADGINYNGKIPQANVPDNKLLYYIEAKGNGKTLSSGDVNAPISIDVVEDKDGPEYANASPANGDSVDTGHPVISVTLDDPNGVNTASVSMKIDGNDFTSKAVISETMIKLTLTADQDLAVGIHTVVVSAKDKLGNASTYSWSFQVLQRFTGGNHYRGTTHNHTNISHDADGAPEDALKAAEKYEYDWFAFSDHSHDIDSSLVGKDSVDHNGMKERTGGSNWQLTKDLANRYTKNGSFVVFPAFEMTSTTWGHSNVFGTNNFIDRVEEGGTYQDLKNYYSWVLTYDNIVAQFNHPAMSANAFANFIPYDKKVDKLFTMLEVGNGSGKYSYANAQDKFFNALDLGWHVAPTYGEDNHDATWGQTKNRTVIVANDLSQESLLDAMKKMRVYMSEDPNFKLDVLASGYYMGSTVDSKTLDFNITGSDPVLESSADPKYSYLKTKSNDNISKVELITNGGRVVDSYTPTTDSTSFNWNPSFTVMGGQQWFVVKVTQKDGDRIYSAPIWSMAQDLAVQVSNINAVDGAIIGGVPADLKAGISNQGSINVSNLVAHFYYDSMDSQHYIGDATIDSLPANTSGSASVTWSNPTAGDHKVIIVLEAKDGHDLGSNKFEQQFTIKAPLGKIILIDATHQNENTTLDAGTYKDNLKLFTVMMRKQGYTILENKALITDQVLSSVNILMVTHPASAYTTNEITAINKYMSNGGSLLLTEKSNFGGSNQNANSLLAGIGSSIQVNNDGVFDETKEGNFWGTPLTSNFSVRLHPTPVNNYLTDFVPTIEYYSGASLAGKGGAGNKVALTDSSSVTVLVKGNESTFQDTTSVKADTVSYSVFTSNGKNGPALDSISGGSKIPLIASETIGNSRVIVTGMNIFNDKQMDQTYNPKGNDPFALNAINWLAHLEPKVSPIGEARTKAEGTEAVIQGKVTTTAFYDAVYVQDETGGIMAFNEVPAGSLVVGDTVRIYGHIKIFENNTELEFDKFDNSIVKINTSPGVPVEPKAVSTQDAYAEANQGQLLKVTGKVTAIPDDNSYLVNDGSGEALVFADGYIINQTGPIPKLQIGDTLEAVGLAGKYADGQRIRVRDTRELKASTLTAPTAAEVAAGITRVAAPSKDATSLTLPVVPSGYTIAIKSSSPTGIIATNGTITPLETDTSVNLVFTVTRMSDSSTADTASITVIVPAKTPSAPTAAEVAAGITRVAAPAKDETSITLPVVPSGYTIAIKSSSLTGIIATNGAITPSETDTSVNLVFTVTRMSDSSTADTASITVIVPAKTPSARTAAEVAAGIATVAAPAKDATSLTLPVVESGYTIAIKSSSPTGIIATNSTITPPETDTSVNLVFTVTRMSDSSTADTSSITVIVPAKTPSAPTAANVNLKSLQLSGMMINFSEDKTDYTLSVGNSVNNVTVTADAVDSSATLEINGDAASSKQIVLSEGLNTITVTVTAKDATARKSYTVLIKRVIVQTVTDTPIQVTTEPVSLIVPTGVTTGSIQVAPTTTGDTKQATLPLVEARATTSIGEINVFIPSGVSISAPAAWDGTIKLPELQANNSVTVTNGNVSAVIEVGVPDLTLTFDKAVRLLIPNQAGKLAGFVRDGVFVTITNEITADTQEVADKLAAGGEGTINVGNDLVIWTKHFTKFASYTDVAVLPITPPRNNSDNSSSSNSVSNTAIISPSVGGTVTINGVKIVIPVDALNTDFMVTIDNITKFADLTADASMKLISDIYEIKKDKENDFTKSLSITIPFDKTNVDLAKSKISIYWFDETTKKWTSLDNPQVDILNAVVTNSVNHFTKFAVFSTDNQEAAAPTTVPEPTPASVDLSDIRGHWAENSIRGLITAGAIDGYPNGTFGPDKKISRAEFAIVIVKAFHLEEKSGKTFADTANHWATKAIQTAAAHGIITGYSDNSFGPDDLITREQMAAMIVRAAKLPAVTSGVAFKDSLDISEWAKMEVATAAASDLVNGYPSGTFNPKENATRAEAATVILKAIKK